MKSFVLIFVLLSIFTFSNAKIQVKEKYDNKDSFFKKIRKFAGTKIKHIITVMEENRSFDNFFGWYGKEKGVNGLTGDEYNRLDSLDPNSKKIYISKNAPFINFCDPAHGTESTSYKMCGPEAESTNICKGIPKMDSFVMYERNNRGYCNVMDTFTPDKLPVITALADEFVLMDRMFASEPGPTWPNRLFFMSGTAEGLTETWSWYQNVPGRLFPHKTIFDQVEEGGGKWRVYYNDTPWELFVETIAHHPENVREMNEFYEDARTGNLPDFAFINPLTGVNLTLGLGSNDQHPDHDVSLGERYYKDIYEALRSSPQWNETLFIVTFDEHGGFYDHVPPPSNVPRADADNISYPDHFTFDRLGMRIPTVLISPWLPKGAVLSAPPPAQKPFPNSEYELTSIMHTARLLLPSLANATALTKRDEWSATFEHLLLDEPRTDCPMHLPDALPPATGLLQREARLPLNGLQHRISLMNAYLGHGLFNYPSHIVYQHQVGDFNSKALKIHKEKTKLWKDSKNYKGFAVVVLPKNSGFFFSSWTFQQNKTVPYITINGRGDGTPYCMDITGGIPVKGANITISRCYPSSDPGLNRDRTQQWVWYNDASLRPYLNQSLCLTSYYNDKTKNDPYVHLFPCTGEFYQHFSYQGSAPGMDDDDGDGEVYYSVSDLAVIQI